MNICIAILVLKIGRKTTFLAYYALLFKKGKNAIEMQKKICAVYGEGAMV